MAIDFISYSRISAYRLMWIIVNFDMPTETKQQRKEATNFRKKLLQDGFTRFQLSMYVRNCASAENTAVHIERVRQMIPPEGKVCILKVTEKQFTDILIFEGRRTAPTPPPAFQLELF